VGIDLQVTPWVIGENKIRMEVSVKVTNVVGYVEIAQGVKNPYTDERFVKNTVLLTSGTTLALGGLYQKETTVIERGVPVLSEIPLLGLLFKSYWTKKQKKELRIYLTPRLIQPYDRFFIPEED
jgi:type II secretory pathway component GspD/PulD (secretin)